jgi:hypothetical protein
VNSTGKWPQPGDGIAGALHDPPGVLSLDEDALATRRMLMSVTRCLMRATLVGEPAPVVSRMYERMRHPEPGDLVMETSSTSRLNTDVFYRAFGVLLDHPRTEWQETDAQWQAGMAGEPESLRGDGNRCTDYAWYVQYGPRPEEVCRWHNADFVMVPADPRFGEVPFESPEAGGISVTRDDVAGAVADSGFRLKQP